MTDRRLLYKYKGDRCASCGKTVEEVIRRHGTFHRMFELNHVDPKNKHPDYDNLIRRVLSTEQLNEVDKCVLLCDHCHNVVHSQGFTGELLLTVNCRKRKVEQRLKGQIIVDLVDRTATFLTNERVLVQPYRVFLGSKKPRILFGQDLENGLLVSYLRRIAHYKTIVVRLLNDHEVMRAEHLGEDRLKLVHDIRCPFFTSELHENMGGPVKFWGRNGIGLTKDGVIHDGTVTAEATLVNPTPAKQEPGETPQT